MWKEAGDCGVVLAASGITARKGHDTWGLAHAGALAEGEDVPARTEPGARRDCGKLAAFVRKGMDGSGGVCMATSPCVKSKQGRRLPQSVCCAAERKNCPTAPRVNTVPAWQAMGRSAKIGSTIVFLLPRIRITAKR